MPRSKRIAIYPGTFDPVTYGHLDVVARASELFDEVVMAIATNSAKKPLFTVEERIVMISRSLRKRRNVRVDSFYGLLVDYAERIRACAIIRGLRAITDFEYEFQMALANRRLSGNITTVFLMPHEKYTYLNSSLVREIAQFGGDVSNFVPPVVAAQLARKVAPAPKRRRV